MRSVAGPPPVRRRIARIDRREASDRVTSSAAELVVGLLAIVAVGAFWWVVPTDHRIRQAAQRYALTLFDAARLLTCDPKLTPHIIGQERS